MLALDTGGMGCATMGFLRMGLEACCVMDGLRASSARREKRAGVMSSGCIVLVGGSGCDGLGEDGRRGLEGSTWCSEVDGEGDLGASAAVLESGHWSAPVDRSRGKRRSDPRSPWLATTRARQP